MLEKHLTYYDGVVPEPPLPSEWRRAPYLGNGDHFWDKVDTFSESSKSNPPINTNTKPLLLEPEIELNQTADHLPASTIPRLLIERGDFPYSIVHYTPTPYTLRWEWSSWCRHICRNQGYCDILRRANILESVSISHSLTVQLDQASIASLAVLLSRWSCETHTFVAPWGEFAPSLEDVYEIFGLPVFGAAESDHSMVSSAEEQEIVGALRSAATEAAKWGSRFQGSVLLDSPPQCSSKYPTYDQWYRHFFQEDESIHGVCFVEQHSRRIVTGPQFGKRYELAGFLSYWLDRFIFEGKPEGGINERVFPMAAALSRGHALPLAPMFLGTLYYRLDMLKQDWARSLGRYEVTTFVSYYFLTSFLHKRFPHYAPKTSIEEGQDASSDYWTRRNLGDYIDAFENFCARPYAVKGGGILGGGPEDLVTVLKDDFNTKTLMFIAIVCNCALPYITETKKGAVAYNPCRIARQFGYDQGVPGPSSCRRSYASSYSRFSSCRELALHQYPATFTIPSCKRQGRYTQRFHEYWVNILKKFIAFTWSSPQPPYLVPIFEDDISLKTPEKPPYLARGCLSRFAVARTTTTATTAQKGYQQRSSVAANPQKHATSCSKRQPPLINPRPPNLKRTRMLSKTNSEVGSTDEAPGSPPVSPSRSEVDESTNTANTTKKWAIESQRLKLLDLSAGTSAVPNTTLALTLPPPLEENMGRDELVQWRGYKCSGRSIPYLDRIFHKHPKTFDGFRVESACFQGMFLDALAHLIKSLAGKRISQITTDDINVARGLMMDWKSLAGLDLSWLEQRFADATARLEVHGLNQESARISSRLQRVEAKAASLRAKCDKLAQKISSQQTLIDPAHRSEDEVLKDLFTDI